MKTRDTRDSENNSTQSAAQILVVDDTPANLKLLVDMLTNSGYQVRAAGSGPLALRSIAVEQPDLILLDIRMPGIDGYEVCRRLKDDERYSDIPVIFLSALNDVPGMIRGFETGAVDYITKPFEPAEVLARIGTHLKLRRLQREMETLVAERTRELHEACRFLEESEERYKTMFEKNVAAIAIVEEDLTISLCNPEFQRLSGFSREEIEGSMLWTDFSADEEEKKKLGNYHRLRMDDPDSAPRNYEYRLRDKTGSPRTLFISVNFLPGTRKSLVTMVDVTDRNRAMAEVEKSLQEKEILLREIHHRVKNNLQIIISLMNLQRIGSEDEKVLQSLKEIQNRIRSMAIVHDLLYQTEYLSRIDFGQYILKITRLLLMSYNIRNSRINIEYRMSDITLDISRAVPCGLIVNEIVTNSMIHGFPDGRKGNILIEMNRQEDTGFILKISDNGVGLSASFDTGTIESIGLTLVDSLVLQLGGTWTISSNGGTEVVMVFPGNPA